MTEPKIIEIIERLIYLSDGDNSEKYDSGYNEEREKLNQQILEFSKLQEKAKLFDSLLIENQTILDTISQIKITNGMYEKENNKLTAESVEKIIYISDLESKYVLAINERDNLKKELKGLVEK